MAFDFRSQLRQGIAIPAHPPLALTSNRRLDARRQLALARYYIAAGVGGLAVGVHTTQVANADWLFRQTREVLNPNVFNYQTDTLFMILPIMILSCFNRIEFL